VQRYKFLPEVGNKFLPEARGLMKTQVKCGDTRSQMDFLMTVARHIGEHPPQCEHRNASHCRGACFMRGSRSRSL